MIWNKESKKQKILRSSMKTEIDKIPGWNRTRGKQIHTHTQRQNSMELRDCIWVYMRVNRFVCMFSWLLYATNRGLFCVYEAVVFHVVRVTKKSDALH